MYIIYLILSFIITIYGDSPKYSIKCVRYAINMSDIYNLNINSTNINKCCYNNFVKDKCYDLINFEKFLYYKNICNDYFFEETVYSIIGILTLLYILHKIVN